MARSARDYSWLPDHQLHVVATIAHADSIIDRVGTLLADYTRPPGCLELETVRDGHEALVRVVSVKPLPPAAAHLTADALTQLRAAIEHTLFAEVEFQLGRSLTPKEARAIEMPASESPTAFDAWLAHGIRRTLAPLQRTAPLVKRIQGLQPLVRRDQDTHPLRLLAEYTNHAKHRAPAVAATLLGAVIPDVVTQNVLFGTQNGRPITTGDILARGPLKESIPLSIWPKVSLQRPHTGTWNLVMQELRDIEEWVRTAAIPYLLLGHSDVTPLPPELDIAIGHIDVRAALMGAGTVPAAERNSIRLQAEVLREGLAETLNDHPDRPDPESVNWWINSLSDAEIISLFERLGKRSLRGDVRGLADLLRELLDAAKSARSAPES